MICKWKFYCKDWIITLKFKAYNESYWMDFLFHVHPDVSMSAITESFMLIKMFE